MGMRNRPYRAASNLTGTNRYERYIEPTADKAPMITYKLMIIASAISLSLFGLTRKPLRQPNVCSHKRLLRLHASGWTARLCDILHFVRKVSARSRQRQRRAILVI